MIWRISREVFLIRRYGVVQNVVGIPALTADIADINLRYEVSGIDGDGWWQLI